MMPKIVFFKKTAFRGLKIFGIIEFLKFCTMLAHVVCSITQGKIRDYRASFFIYAT